MIASARARAWLEGRDFVTPEDIQALVHDWPRHRVLVTFEAQAQGIGIDHVLDELLARVPVAYMRGAVPTLPELLALRAAATA